MERTNTARSDPGTSTFSRYRPSPRRNRGSSVLSAGMPNVEGGTATADMLPQPTDRNLSGRRPMRTIRVLTGATCFVLVTALASSAVARGPAPQIRVGKAVASHPVKTGLNGPAGFTFAPGGKIWYLERGTGQVHILNPKNHQGPPVLHDHARRRQRRARRARHRAASELAEEAVRVRLRDPHRPRRPRNDLIRIRGPSTARGAGSASCSRSPSGAPRTTTADASCSGPTASST